MIAQRWGLSRQQLDEFSLASHEKAAAASDDGRFDAQLVPVPSRPRAAVAHLADEGVRSGGTLDSLAS